MRRGIFYENDACTRIHAKRDEIGLKREKGYFCKISKKKKTSVERVILGKFEIEIKPFVLSLIMGF